MDIIRQTPRVPTHAKGTEISHIRPTCCGCCGKPTPPDFSGEMEIQLQFACPLGFKNTLEAILYCSARRSSLSASGLNNVFWRRSVSAPLISISAEATRTTRRVSSSVCRHASLRHSAETRQQRGTQPTKPFVQGERLSTHVLTCWRSRARAF